MKVSFKDIPKGASLTPEMVFVPLQSVAAQLQGNIAAGQRQHGRSLFVVPVYGGRMGAETATWSFTLPPVQEIFNGDRSEDLSHPAVRLESLSFSFDSMNSNKPVSLDTGTTDPSASYTQDAFVSVSWGPHSTKVSIPLSVISLTNTEAPNKPNPTVVIDVGAQAPLYTPILVEMAGMGPGTIPPGLGTESVLAIATFSAPLVERDTSPVPQNSPLHDNVRVPATVSVVAPAAKTLIEATNASSTGVQDGIEIIDRVFRGKLSGGLSRWSALPSGEHLTEDQGYFCMTVPMHLCPEDDGYTQAPGENGYCHTNLATMKLEYMSAARIPITAPGAIHHVHVKFAQATAPGYQIRADVGVGLGAGFRGTTRNYSQVALLAGHVWTNEGDIVPVPLVYSNVTGTFGTGFAIQGRPYFFGKELDTTPGAVPVRRRDAAYNVADVVAEGTPNTNGLEEFIEVRANISLWDPVGPAPQDITVAAHSIGEGTGVTVYIYGKMALVE